MAGRHFQPFFDPLMYNDKGLVHPINALGPLRCGSEVLILQNLNHSRKSFIIVSRFDLPKQAQCTFHATGLMRFRPDL